MDADTTTCSCGMRLDMIACYRKQLPSLIRVPLHTSLPQWPLYFEGQPRAKRIDCRVGASDFSPNSLLRVREEEAATETTSVAHFHGNVFVGTVFVPYATNVVEKSAKIKHVESPYAGGVFFFEMDASSPFPLAPPRVQCLTRIFHQTLHGDVTHLLTKLWTRKMRMIDALNALERILLMPDSSNAAQVSSAGLLVKNAWSSFDSIAARWTRQFACFPIPWGKWSRAYHRAFPRNVREAVKCCFLLRRRLGWSKDVTMLIASFVATPWEEHRRKEQISLSLEIR